MRDSRLPTKDPVDYRGIRSDSLAVLAPLAIAMALTLSMLAGCGEESTPLEDRFGLGDEVTAGKPDSFPEDFPLPDGANVIGSEPTDLTGMFFTPGPGVQRQNVYMDVDDTPEGIHAFYTEAFTRGPWTEVPYLCSQRVIGFSPDYLAGNNGVFASVSILEFGLWVDPGRVGILITYGTPQSYGEGCIAEDSISTASPEPTRALSAEEAEVASVVKDWYEAYNTQDWETLYALASPRSKGVCDYNSFSNGLQNLADTSDFYALSEVSYFEIEIDDDTAEARFVLAQSDGGTGTGHMTLVEMSGAWFNDYSGFDACIMGIGGPATAATRQASDGNAPGIPHLDGDVETTESGLQYIDEEVGSGAFPEEGDTIALRFISWTLEGHQLGGGTTSELFGESFTDDVWEGISTMKEGGKRRLINVSDYNNETTIWDIELLSVD